jgi:hypothetical protein
MDSFISSVVVVCDLDHLESLYQPLGFHMGMGQVGNLHTVPVQPWLQYPQVTGMVSHKTHGVGGTRRFLMLSNPYYYYLLIK